MPKNAIGVAIGGKRTCRFALHMPAYDPKRTLAYRSTTHLCPLQCASLGSFRRRVLIIGCRREAARVHHISRRLGGVAARSARAAAGMPVVGFINAAAAQSYKQQLSDFLKGLSEAGYVDGRNVAIEYRWAEGQIDRLPAMVADLVHRHVAVIAATTTPAALAAKAATTTIPIVFELGSDPVRLGLVASFSRPGGNVTGAAQSNVEVAPKRLELLHELAPTARIMALLVNPADAANAETAVREVRAAARAFGLELHVLNASNEDDFDAVFAKLIQLRAGGLVIGGGTLFAGRSERLAALALHHAVPAISYR